MSAFPKLVIRVPEARAVFATVELDGKRLPATRVVFDTGDVADTDGVVHVTVTFYADLDLAIEGVPLRLTSAEDKW